LGELVQTENDKSKDNIIMLLLQTNTYQGIVVTNGDQSYALFTYRCGQLGWSGGATIGFSAAGDFYYNYKMSGTSSVKNVACENSPESSWTNIIYQLSKYYLMH